MSELSPWKNLMVLRKGSSHEATDLPCQDFGVGRVLDGGAFVGVIADGAGSAACSERGSRLIAETMAEAVACHLPLVKVEGAATVLRFAANSARAAVVKEAEAAGRPHRDYAATLLAVLWTPAGGAALQRGDGLIATRTADESWQWALWPQRGEYANVTFFLTDDDAIDGLATVELSGDVTDIALTSDGFETLVLQTAPRTVHAPPLDGFADRLVRAADDAENAALVKDIATFFGSKLVRSRTDDDLSLVLATRRTEVTPLPVVIEESNEPNDDLAVESAPSVAPAEAETSKAASEARITRVPPATKVAGETSAKALKAYRATLGDAKGDPEPVPSIASSKPAPSDAIAPRTPSSQNAESATQDRGETVLSPEKSDGFLQRWVARFFPGENPPPQDKSADAVKATTNPVGRAAVKSRNHAAGSEALPGAGEPRA